MGAVRIIHPSPQFQSWAYFVRAPRTALFLVCGNWVRKCFVFRRSSLNHRSWISEPVLSIWSNCSGCFEKSILLAPQSGRRPSVSVNRYSRPSSQELKSCPVRSKIAGSPANATTARPTNNGDSDFRKFRSFLPPSRQVSSVTPNRSSIVSDRRKPGGNCNRRYAMRK
jgi:hypothetical protein